MQANQIPDEFLSRIRVSVVAALLNVPKTFGQLKQVTESTDGNLDAHLMKIEEAGAVSIDRAFVGRRPRTTVTLTPLGRRRFTDYVELLSRLVQEADVVSGRQDDMR